MIYLLACVIVGSTDDSSKESSGPRTCDQVTTELADELARIQTCAGAWDCGQELKGSSCGCTRNLVARADASLDEWQRLMAEGSDLGCDLGASSCDCPAAVGYACEQSTCTWNYLPSNWGTCSGSGDPFTYDSLSITGDTALVGVHYGGGCTTHSFTTCWPDLSFAESDPVQVSLQLSHEGNDDPCDSIVEETIEVDLSLVRRAWQSMYRQEHGEIRVKIGDQQGLYSF
jgi:hypothetical protein